MAVLQAIQRDLSAAAGSAQPLNLESFLQNVWRMLVTSDQTLSTPAPSVTLQATTTQGNSVEQKGMRCMRACMREPLDILTEGIHQHDKRSKSKHSLARYKGRILIGMWVRPSQT